jgi:hypothetical protein
MLGVGGWMYGREVDLTPYKPTWWLRRDVGGAAAASRAAVTELTRRLNGGTLSGGQVDAIANRLLALQAGPATWDDQWGAFVESARSAGRLDRERWATYLRQAVDVGVRVKDPTRQGEAAKLELGAQVVRRDRALVAALIDVIDLRVDGRPVAWDGGYRGSLAGHHALLMSHVGGWSVSSSVPSITAEATRQMSVGGHGIQAVLRLQFYDATDVPGGRAYLIPPRADRLLSTIDVTTPLTPFVISPPRPTVPTLIGQTTADRAAAAASVRDLSVTQQDDRLIVVRGRIECPPVRVGFAVLVRLAGARDLDTGLATCRAGASVPFNGATLGSLAAVPRVDVVFRPDAESLGDGTDLTPIWGEEVVVHDVPVERSPH